MYIKKLFIITLLGMIACTANAKSLLFTLKSGAKVYYLLGGTTNPVMRFDDGKVCVNTDTYEISDIKNFCISAEDDPNAIAEVTEETLTRFQANTFTLKASEKSLVCVYNIKGVEVKAEIHSAEGFININLEKLPKGVYIIKVGDSSFKVMKK